MRRTCVLALALVFTLAGPAHPTAAADATSEAVARAKALTQKQDFKQARAILERACADAPRDAAAHELLGFCLMKLFLFDEASDAFARGEQQDRYHDVNFGFCLRKAGRLPEALQAFKRAQGVLGAQDSWAAYCTDQIAELEPLGKARAVLCLAQADDFVMATLNGKTIARAKAGGEAAVVLDPHLHEGKNEIHLAAVNTSGPWAYRMRLYVGGKQVWWAGAGYAAKMCGAFENDATVGIVGEARLLIDASLDGEPAFAKAEGGVAFATVVQKLQEAEAAWKQNDFGAAIKIYETQAKEFPKLDVFHLKLADACDEIALTMQDPGPESQAKRERLKKAAGAARDRWLEVRKMVAQLAGDDAGAYMSLGQACSSIGKFPDGEAALKKALELDPNRVEAMVGLADVLVKQGGKGAEAKDWAEKAIEKLPSWPYAHCILGDALLDMGDAQAALASYFKAIDLDPTQGEWMYGKIAVAMNKGGANAAAISGAIKAAAKAGKDAAAQKALGDAYLRGLKYEEALAAYRAARGIDPKLSGVATAEGLCFELTGKAQPALKAYERGLEDTDDEMKELARRRGVRVKFFAEPPKRERLPPGERDVASASGPGKDRVVAAIDGLKAARPVLAEGLKRLPPLRSGELTEDDAKAVERIAELAQHARAREELRHGLELIEREVRKRPGPIKVDGDLGEWSRAERVDTDPPGDQLRGSPQGADLAEFYATIDGERLYLGWRFHGGAKVTAACSTWAHLYPVRRGVPWIAVGICADDCYLVRFTPDGKREQLKGSDTQVQYEVGSDAIEASVPLSWLDGERRLQAEAYTFSPNGAKLDTIAETQPPVRIDDGYSPSLLALFNMAKDVTLEADDRPAVAIALASGDYYALGDKAVDDLVEDDDRRMLRFARTLKVWQKAMGLPALDTLPMNALLFWANRTVQWRGTDAAEYRRDAVSPATLEAMFRFAQKHAWRGKAPGDVVEQCEKFLIDPKRWQYTSYEMVTKGIRARAGESVSLSDSEKKDLNKFVREVTIDGRKLNTDGTFNPDLQFDYLLATDALLGHCGNLAQTVVDFSRAVGVPATICQGIEEQSRAYKNPHAFPVYFDAAAKVWRSFQGRKYKGIRQLTLFFFLPPLRPPEAARPTGGGSYWFPYPTTYDEAGPLFSNGFEADFLKTWLDALVASTSK